LALAPGGEKRGFAAIALARRRQDGAERHAAQQLAPAVHGGVAPEQAETARTRAERGIEVGRADGALARDAPLVQPRHGAAVQDARELRTRRRQPGAGWDRGAARGCGMGRQGWDG